MKPYYHLISNGQIEFHERNYNKLNPYYSSPDYTHSIYSLLSVYWGRGGADNTIMLMLAQKIKNTEKKQLFLPAAVMCFLIVPAALIF